MEDVVLNPRSSLIGAGLVFGVWEAADAFRIDVPGFAVFFSVVFLGCSALLWRRASAWPAGVMLVFFASEVAAAPGWKDATTATKALAMVLGSFGGACAVAVLVGNRRRRRAAAGAAT